MCVRLFSCTLNGKKIDVSYTQYGEIHIHYLRTCKVTHRQRNKSFFNNINYITILSLHLSSPPFSFSFSIPFSLSLSLSLLLLHFLLLSHFPILALFLYSFLSPYSIFSLFFLILAVFISFTTFLFSLSLIPASFLFCFSYVNIYPFSLRLTHPHSLLTPLSLPLFLSTSVILRSYIRYSLKLLLMNMLE